MYDVDDKKCPFRRYEAPAHLLRLLVSNVRMLDKGNGLW
jgi:hypothetical protein